MKIAIISDCHLNRKSYKGVMDNDLPDLPFRNVDFMKSFDFMCDKCVNQIKPDLMVIAGDIYDHYEPSNEVRGYFSSRMRKLMKEKIPVAIITGNHDVCMSHHGLKDLQELGLSKLRIMDCPHSFDFMDKKLLFFPYSLDVERKKITNRGLFEKFVGTLKHDVDPNNTIFFGHMAIKGAVKSEFLVSKLDKDVDMAALKAGIRRKMVNSDAADVSLKDLALVRAKHIYLGDYHRFQTLPVLDSYAMYTGSIEKSDFSETEDKKGFVVYDDNLEEDVEMGRSRFIEYPYCRPMLELRGNIDEMRHSFDTMDYDHYQKAVVKLLFIGDRHELFQFSNRLEFLKKDIRDKIKPVHIFHKQNVIDIEQQQKAIELEQSIEQNGHMGREEIINVVVEALSEKIKDESERKRTISLAETIYQEVYQKSLSLR